MARTTKKDVVKKDDANKLPAEALDLLADAGEKFEENMTRDDMSIPFLKILQAMSPECTRGEPEFIKGAEPSMLFNTLTQDLYPTIDDDDKPVAGVTLIPIAFRASYIEWGPERGQFITEHPVAVGASIRTTRNDKNQDVILPNQEHGTAGNRLNFTHTHFVFQVIGEGDDLRVEPLILTMSVTQVKPSKDWNGMIAKMMDAGVPGKPGSKAPRFLKMWDVSTRQRSNDQGTWSVWRFMPTDRLITEVPGAVEKAIKQAEAFALGAVTVDHAQAESGPTQAPDSGGEGGDDNMPF